MRYHLTAKSANPKTGPIPVSTTSRDTCPKTCGMYKACYAKSGPLSLHWHRLNTGQYGLTLRQFLRRIGELPKGTLWRHNQAGDLPGKDASIDTKALSAIVQANQGKRGFTYTHKPMDRAENRKAIERANRNGFTINLSADNLVMADRLSALGIAPVATVLPANQLTNTVTPEGRTVVICPAISHKAKGVTCATCKLCAWSDREVIIGFPAHGSRKALIQIS